MDISIYLNNYLSVLTDASYTGSTTGKKVFISHENSPESRYKISTDTADKYTINLDIDVSSYYIPRNTQIDNINLNITNSGESYINICPYDDTTTYTSVYLNSYSQYFDTDADVTSFGVLENSQKTMADYGDTKRTYDQLNEDTWYKRQEIFYLVPAYCNDASATLYSAYINEDPAIINYGTGAYTPQWGNINSGEWNNNWTPNKFEEKTTYDKYYIYGNIHNWTYDESESWSYIHPYNSISFSNNTCNIPKWLDRTTDSSNGIVNFKLYFIIYSRISFNEIYTTAENEKALWFNNLVRPMYDWEIATGCFCLNLNLRFPLWQFPTTLDKSWFNITGCSESNQIDGNGVEHYDIDVNCSSAGYIKDASDNSIGIQYIGLDMSARLESGQSVVITSDNKTSTDSSIDKVSNQSTIIGEYDASYNSSGSNRHWTYSGGDGGIFLSLRQAYMEYEDAEEHVRYDTSYNFTYDLYQAKPGNTLSVSTKSEATTISGAKQDLNSQFTINYNVKWYLRDIQIKAKFNNEESIYNYYFKLNNGNVIADSSSWTNGDSLDNTLKQYVKEYVEYLFNNTSKKCHISDVTSLSSDNINIKTYGHTLKTLSDSDLTISFIFNEYRTDEDTPIEASANYNQSKAEFGYYTDNELSNPVSETYHLDPFKYNYGEGSLNFYFKDSGAAYKSKIEYGDNTTNDCSIEYDGNTVFSGSTSIAYNKSSISSHIPIRFSFPPTKSTEFVSTYTLSSSATGIDNNNKSTYLDNEYTSIQISTVSTFEQEKAILSITYDGLESPDSLPADEQYPKLKIISSNPFFINKGDAETYISLQANRWGGNDYYITGYGKYGDNTPTRDNSIFYINEDSGAALKNLLLLANESPTSVVKSDITIWSGNSITNIGAGTPDNSTTLTLTQTVAGKTYTYTVFGKEETGTYGQLTTGETAKDFKQDGSEKYYLKIYNSSNQTAKYTLTSNNNNFTINDKKSETIDSISAKTSTPDGSIILQAKTNDSKNNQNYSLIISNGTISFNLYFTQQGGDRGVAIEGTTIIVNNEEHTDSIVVKNTGTITANYRITGEDNFILFSESAATTTGNIAPNSSVPISYKILANNTDEKRTGYITAEDVNDAFLTNTRKGVIQSGHNKPIFYLQCVDKSDETYSYPSSSEIKGEKYLKFTINPSTLSLPIDISTKIEIITTSGCSVETNTSNISFPANYKDVSIFYVKFDDNATNEKLERYVTVNAYFDGVELTSEIYTKSTPYSVAYQLYAAPNATVDIVGYDSGEYRKNGYYIFGPGIGTREITVYDQNSGPCTWSKTNEYNLNNYSINFIPASNTSTTKMVISTNNINSATSISDSSYKILASNTLTSHWSTSSSEVNLRRYPQPSFSAVLYKGDASYNQSISLNASDFSKNKESIDISIVINSGTNVNYSYEIIEYNTTGNEFMLTSNSSGQPWTLSVPKNISTTLDKKCIIRFTYNYDNTIPDHDVDRYVTLTIISQRIGNASIDVKRYEGTSSYSFPTDSSYPYNFKHSDDSSNGIILDISVGENLQKVVWDYTTSETGTEGGEFIVSKYSDSINNISINGLKIIVPNNTSYYNEKICYLNLTYYYAGCTDETQYNTITYKLSVDTAPAPVLNLYKSSSPDSEKYPDNSSFAYDFDGSTSIYINNYDSSNGLPIMYSVVSSESGTAGNEFIIKNETVDSSWSKITVEIPTNTSSISVKKCILTFNYYYEESVNPVIESKSIELTVDKAGQPSLRAYKKCEDGSYKDPYDSENTYNYYDASTIDIYLRIPDSSNKDSENLPIVYEYSTVESGTEGNEFILSNTGNNHFKLTIPKNVSYDNIKSCYVTFKYYYDGTTEESGKRSVVYRFIVNRANVPSIHIKDSSDNEYSADTSYGCDFGAKDGSKGILMFISPDSSNHLPIVYSYESVESGTTGNEFIITKEAYDENDADIDQYRITIPTNTSTTIQKKCQLTFKYYYEGTKDETQYQTKVLRFTVNTIGKPSIVLKDSSKEGTEIAEDVSYGCDYALKDGSTGIKIYVDDSNNLLPISYEYSITENGTEGNEFLISKKDNVLTLLVPTNTSLINKKSCYLTVKYYYSGVKDSTQFETKVIKFVINTASKPTVTIDPINMNWPGVISDTSIDIDVSISCDNSLNVTWVYEAIETGTTGNEFSITKTDSSLHLVVPSNKSLDTNKVCKITVTCYYSEAKEHINDSYAIGTYSVGYVVGPIISFDYESTISDPSTSHELTCSEDTNNYDISIYRIHDPSSLYTDATKAVLDKTDLTYNSIKFGEITSGSSIPFIGDSSSLNINVYLYDNEYDISLYDYVYITGYDDNGHSGTICRLKITQSPKKNYCPTISTSKVSVTATTDQTYYNLGFSKYNTSSDLSESNDFYIKKSFNDWDDFEIVDYGFKIKESASNSWTNIWNSKYADALIFTSSSSDSSTYKLYTGSLPYTNSVFKYSPNKNYDYAGIAVVNYRNGKSEKSEWVMNETITGEIKHFKLGEYKESNLEYIRPYFKPVEKVNGYLTGVEIKNFINSKGVVFNRKKSKTIDIVNWYSNYTLTNNKLVLNINDALIDLVLNSDAFNKSWNYINDPTRIIDAKKLYIKKNILPNIIISSGCKLDIYYDSNSSTKGILSKYDSSLVKVENLSHSLKYSATDNSYTLNMNLPENKQYCIILHLQY